MIIHYHYISCGWPLQSFASTRLVVLSHYSLMLICIMIASCLVEFGNGIRKIKLQASFKQPLPTYPYFQNSTAVFFYSLSLRTQPSVQSWYSVLTLQQQFNRFYNCRECEQTVDLGASPPKWKLPFFISCQADVFVFKETLVQILQEQSFWSYQVSWRLAIQQTLFLELVPSRLEPGFGFHGQISLSCHYTN